MARRRTGRSRGLVPEGARLTTIGDRLRLAAMVLTLLWVGAAGSAGLSAQPAERDAAQAGGSAGVPFRETCGVNVLTGFNLRLGDALDSISPVCGDFDSQWRRVSTLAAPGRSFGGGGGRGLFVECPYGMAVRGLVIDVNRALVGRIDLLCENPATRQRNVQTARSYITKNEHGGWNLFQGAQFNCRDDEVAWGIAGRSSSMVDRVGLICRARGAFLASPAPGRPNGKVLPGIGKAVQDSPPKIALDDRFRCRAYADRAVAANLEAAQLGCGLTGGRHRASLRDHMVWCLENPPGAAATEERARAAEVGLCRARATAAAASTSDSDWCIGYAARAEAANMEAAQRSCGLSGARHQASRGQHLAWCATVPRPVALSEEAARTAALGSCRRAQAPGE